MPPSAETCQTRMLLIHAGRRQMPAIGTPGDGVQPIGGLAQRVQSLAGRHVPHLDRAIRRAEASSLPSGLKAMPYTESLWSFRTRSSFFAGEATSQNLMSRSYPQLARILPSGLKARS